MCPPRPCFTPTTLALALVALAHGAAHGQDNAPVLPAVQVTAKGYAASDLDTAASTLSLSRDALRRRGAQNLGEALRGEPGVAVAQDSAQGQNPVIRGLSRESIVLLVDGMRLNAGQPAGALASFMSLGLADGVEVVKGGASVLYGTGALGGVVQVRLPQAQFQAGTHGRTSLSVDTASQAVRGSATVNTSHGDHALMLGGSVARVEDDRSPRGKVARTGYDSDAFIGQYRFRLDGQRQLRVSAQRQQDDDVWYPGSTRPATAAPAPTVTVHSPKQTRHLYELGYQQQGVGGQPLNVDVRLYQQRMDRQINGFHNTLQRDVNTNQVAFTTHGLDARADWQVHPQHLLSAGVNAWEMKGQPDRRVFNPVAGTWTVNNPFENATIRAVGVYAQDDVRLGATQVLLGLRHDTLDSDADSIGNGSISTGLDKRYHATSGNIGLIHEVSPLWRPYANHARAFRAPGMRERFESGPRADGYTYVANPDVKPETSDQFELGLKGGVPGFDYRVAVWHQRIEDYLTGEIINASTKRNANLGEMTLRGVDAQARWQIHPRHVLRVAYSQVRGTNKDLNEPLFQMPADELSLGWQGPLTAGLQADVNWRLVARQDRVATQFSKGTENATGGFGTLDLGLDWQMTRTQRLRAVIKNLADKAYHEHLTEGLSGTEILAPGRSLQVSWTTQF